MCMCINTLVQTGFLSLFLPRLYYKPQSILFEGSQRRLDRTIPTILPRIYCWCYSMLSGGFHTFSSTIPAIIFRCARPHNELTQIRTVSCPQYKWFEWTIHFRLVFLQSADRREEGRRFESHSCRLLEWKREVDPCFPSFINEEIASNAHSKIGRASGTRTISPLSPICFEQLCWNEQVKWGLVTMPLLPDPHPLSSPYPSQSPPPLLSSS